ncbi:protein TONSOKU isoform X2 [Nymphaea colorata]|uniref:protein TONSOKU isoform X2 n=1 Tax=Nymphaea colorata TaxID=210225 RepID=UPI00129E98DB|nr:protein TONSOKU isoform X2 [Nymphaea colorata]
MARNDQELKAAKNAYKEAVATGNRREEARWANVMGDLLRRRGEYVEALRWLRIDYDVSVKHLPEKHLLPTCQSLGEVYLRLESFEDALVYQKMHLELAKKAGDLVEEQRASTQLGRTYHEIFLRSEKDHDALRNSKKYFRSAMDLARDLQENPHHRGSFFLKELIDAYNNLGLLEMDLDNLDEALAILLEGLKICDQEEVKQDDDGRSRLHHNLGRLYMELRVWDKAKYHTERDILICRSIGHAEGEAKGFINLGELHNRVQKYDEAIVCYQKALKIAKSMEDENALVALINENINTVKGASEELDKLKKEEQNLKKLSRNAVFAKGTDAERKILLEQSASLDRLIEISSLLQAWPRHWEFAKRKKRVARELCDKEKLADSLLAIGESYQNLRNFPKACKWYTRSLDAYKSIRNLKGQSLAKTNIGAALDSDGDWLGALDAFEEGYRIAVKGNLLDEQILALDNMHYSYMIRFDDVEKARKLQVDIDRLKSLQEDEVQHHNLGTECCSETETACCLSDTGSDEDVSSQRHVKPFSALSDPPHNDKEIGDDLPLSMFLKRNKRPSQKRTSQLGFCTEKAPHSSFRVENISVDVSRSTDDQQLGSRKRVRVIISDDEDSGNDESGCSREEAHNPLTSNIATSQGVRSSPLGASQDHKASSHPDAQKDNHSICESIHLEASSSYRSDNHKSNSGNEIRCKETGAWETTSNTRFVSKGSTSRNTLLDQGEFDPLTSNSGDSLVVPCKIDETMVHLDLSSCTNGDKVNVDSMKVELACLYYLRLPKDKCSRGMLPIIQLLKWNEKTLDLLEPVKQFEDYGNGKGCIEAVISGWIHKRLMKLYVDYCSKTSESPNMKLLRKLYNLEVSEDEVIVSDCELDDMSILPFLDALYDYPVAIMDLSHNVLGNETMKKLHQIFVSTTHIYGSLTLDLHQNRFGATALFQVCECPVLFSRLEVLNLSENRLTDACASYLSVILKNCKALYSLNLEKCSITSRTVQTIADSIQSESSLSHLALGKNNPISVSVIMHLLDRLSCIRRFSELSLTGVRLGQAVIDSLCKFAGKVPSLAALALGNTCIGSDGAVILTEALSNVSQEFVKLDISNCGVRSCDMIGIFRSIASTGILELNISGNSIEQKGVDGLASLLTSSRCFLRVLKLDGCHLGLSGILCIVEALSGNNSLEELSLSENVDSNTDITAMEVETVEPVLDVHEADVNGLVAADSEEGSDREGPNDDTCASSSQSPEANLASSKTPEMTSEHEPPYLAHLSRAIINAKQLQCLDLSGNGFTSEVVEKLYSSWSSSTRIRCSTARHTENEIVHFSVQGKQCCGVRSCCKKDWCGSGI